MKRIKITEAQAKRLNLISENTDPISSFEHFCRIKAQEVDRLYSKLTVMSIGEIINNEVNVAKLTEMLDKIESEVRAGSRMSYQHIKNMPEDNSDLRIDDAEDLVMDKLTPLQLFVMDLERLQNSIDDSRLTTSFNDINPLDITGLQK